LHGVDPWVAQRQDFITLSACWQQKWRDSLIGRGVTGLMAALAAAVLSVRVFASETNVDVDINAPSMTKEGKITYEDSRSVIIGSNQILKLHLAANWSSGMVIQEEVVGDSLILFKKREFPGRRSPAENVPDAYEIEYKATHPGNSDIIIQYLLRGERIATTTIYVKIKD
jgi:hypothetical protein